MSAQLANGAVLIHPNGTGVTPYYSNLALQAVLLATREYDSAVKDYLIWYLENLNDPDNLGVSGTIYDYHWDGAVLTSRDDYDSSDSYAATFLSLLNEYYQQTGDRTFIEDNLAAIKLVASAIASTEQADGLTYALINYHVKYLMDNTEVWRGYVDYADLLGAIGDSDSAIYTAKAAQIAAAIEDQMWHSTGEEYFYYAGDTAVDWLVFYPDATANLWPTIFGLSINAERNSLLLQKFLTNQPAWLTCEANEFPWAAIALGAAKGSEDSTVLAYDQYLQQKFLADQHYPWNINDAGWRIRYLLELSR
jgi:hypothetical protein